MVGASTAKILPLRSRVIVDSRRDDELLVDSLAAAEKNDEIVFLRIFALAFGPGDDVVGVVKNQIVSAADQIAQQGRRVGHRVDFGSNVLLFEKAFAFGGDDRRVAIEQTDFNRIFSHSFDRQQRQRRCHYPLYEFHRGLMPSVPSVTCQIQSHDVQGEGGKFSEGR